MSEQDNGQVLTLQRPTTDDEDEWIAYWEQQGQPWRWEPEIDKERQKYLAKRRHRLFKGKSWVFPLDGVSLSRADVEWLAATHKAEYGAIDLDDRGQPMHRGLDLYGADLRGVNLDRLPLARAYFFNAHFEGASLGDAHLEEVNFAHAHLEGANLRGAYLQETFLMEAHLEGADLIATHLEGANLMNARLEGANLYNSHLNSETQLNNISLVSREKGAVTLADVHWGDVNLAVIDWSPLSTLGDESSALHLSGAYATPPFKLEFLKRATRAYRQLAIVLRSQGLNEDAARFAYRGQRMQRKLFWRQRQFGQYLFSLLLALVSGYGYKPIRSFIAYLIVIVAFATAYFIIGRTIGPTLSPLGSVVFSMTSFHGRGFFPGGIGLDDPLTVVAALEAFVGLLIEVTFIATLTQRLFGK